MPGQKEYAGMAEPTDTVAFGAGAGPEGGCYVPQKAAAEDGERRPEVFYPLQKNYRCTEAGTGRGDNKMETQREPLESYSYQITQEEYVGFNFELAEQSFAKQKKKAMIMGCIEIAAALLFLITLIMQPQEKNQTLYLALDVLLLVFGLYSVVFYRIVFPRQLQKAAVKQYEKNEYLQNRIQVDFYEDEVFEKSGDYENTLPYEELHGFEETDTLFKVMLTKTRCILMPKPEIEDHERLRQLFAELAEKWELPFQDSRKGQPKSPAGKDGGKG